MLDRDQVMAQEDYQLNEGEVYPVLRRAIEELFLQPGVILSIKDICEYYKIGRSPVRDALIRLDQEGLVTLLPQRGTMISKIDIHRVEQERFLRYSVEEQVMKLFMACHTPSDITDLNESLRQQYELCSKKEFDVRAFLRLDDAFHEIFYRVTNKQVCLTTIKNIWGHYRRMRLLSFDNSIKIDEILGQHAALITAFQSRDTELMGNVFNKHLYQLNQEERYLIKKYPNLFVGGKEQGTANSLWEGDYLQVLKSGKGQIHG